MEDVRDFTSLGSPFLLGVLTLLVVGANGIALGILIGLCVVEFTCDVIKVLYFKERPRVESYTNFLQKIRSASFPSIHTARSAFVFLCLYVESTTNTKLLYLLLPVIVAWTRVKLRKHRMVDVVAGGVIAMVHFLVYQAL